jgi:hypothetical protein
MTATGRQKNGETANYLSFWPGNIRSPRGFLPSKNRQDSYSNTSIESNACRCSPGWAVSNHFQICTKFEHSLPRKVTRSKTSSTTTGSDWPQGHRLVVQVSGGTLTRKSSVTPLINTKSESAGKYRVDTIFRAGLVALLFFCRILISFRTPIAIPDHVIAKSDRAQL